MKVSVSLAKNILAPLGITAAASVIDQELKITYIVLDKQL